MIISFRLLRPVAGPCGAIRATRPDCAFKEDQEDAFQRIVGLWRDTLLYCSRNVQNIPEQGFDSCLLATVFAVQSGDG
jgi:hypothetical protein